VLAFRRRRAPERAPAIVIGTGAAGRALACALLNGPYDLRPIGFLSTGAEPSTVAGLPVLGRAADLAEVAERSAAPAVVVAAPGLPKEQLTELVGRAWAAGLDLRWLPASSSVGDVRAVRELRMSRLVGREEISVAGNRARRLIEGRRILVTGAAGETGAALAGMLCRLAPAGLWLLDRDRAGLAPLAARGTPVPADLHDADAMERLFDQTRPELVFHAAGRSRLAELESRPCSAVTANVRATDRLVAAAVRHRVGRFVLVSTDKAADPASVLGASKRLAEVVTQLAAGGPTRFAAVRLGNLLGVPGSLLSVLAGRLPRGEAVTITHPEVARNFMTAGEAAGSVLEGAALAEEAETFGLDLGGPVPVVDVVHRYAEQLGLPEVTIRFNGLGPGEKLAETLFADGERRVRTAHPRILATRPTPLPSGLGVLLTELYAAAEAGDDDAVRLLLRRSLPEYRPARRAVGQRESR
jgi:FlaA1/EpsC-like NDP-sugar epimerase